MDVAHVKWSQTEYTLQKYVSKFSKSFPGIIRITEGFLGKQEIDSISSGTVIRVHSLYRQFRVTAETKNGKLFSLPTKMKSFTFLPVQSNGLGANSVTRTPQTLEDILAMFNLPVTVQTSKALYFKEKGDGRSKDEKLCELTLQEIYEEIFLLGHPIDKGKLFTSEPIIIPMYMKELKLVVATGLLRGNTDKWKRECAMLTQQVMHQGDLSHATFEEVYLLDKQDVRPQEHNYNMIEPIYIDINEFNSDTNKPLPNKPSANVNQYQTVIEINEIQDRKTENRGKTAETSCKSDGIYEVSSGKYKHLQNKYSSDMNHYQIISELKVIQDRKTENKAKTAETSLKSNDHSEVISDKSKPMRSFNVYQDQIRPELPKKENNVKTAETSFKSVHEVPNDMHSLTVKQVCDCLSLLNMGQYIQAFEAAQVDGQLVYDLNEDMMKGCLGMNVLNSIKFLKFRDGWRPNVL